MDIVAFQALIMVGVLGTGFFYFAEPFESIGELGIWILRFTGFWAIVILLAYTVLVYWWR